MKIPAESLPEAAVRAAQAAEDSFWGGDDNYPENEADYDNQAMLDKATRLAIAAAMNVILGGPVAAVLVEGMFPYKLTIDPLNLLPHDGKFVPGTRTPLYTINNGDKQG